MSQITLQGTPTIGKGKSASKVPRDGVYMLALRGYLHPTHVLRHLCIILYSLLLPYPYSIIRY